MGKRPWENDGSCKTFEVHTRNIILLYIVAIHFLLMHFFDAVSEL